MGVGYLFYLNISWFLGVVDWNPSSKPMALMVVEKWADNDFSQKCHGGDCGFAWRSDATAR